jgi:hypothetical protein
MVSQYQLKQRYIETIRQKSNRPKRQVSCQIPNYLLLAKYCRYILNTCTLYYLGIGCQIKLIMNGDLKLKMDET